MFNTNGSSFRRPESKTIIGIFAIHYNHPVLKMFKKLLQGFIVTSLIVLIPVIGNIAMLKAPHLWILIVIGVLASLFQPRYNPFKSSPDHKDKGTANQIIWSIYLTQFFMLVESVYFRYPSCIIWSGLTTITLTVMIAGLFLRTWAVLTLGVFFTWHIAVQKNQGVITKGPYAFIRHPGYLGAFLTYVSTTLFMHAWIACAVSIPVLLFAFIRRIYYEEKELKTGLGENYEHYCIRVNRLIPWVW